MYVQNRPKFTPANFFNEAIKPNMDFDKEISKRVYTNLVNPEPIFLCNEYIVNPYPLLLWLTKSQLSDLCKNCQLSQKDLNAVIFLMSKFEHQSVLTSSNTSKIRKYLSLNTNHLRTWK